MIDNIVAKYDIPYIETSSKNNLNVNEVFEFVSTKFIEKYSLIDVPKKSAKTPIIVNSTNCKKTQRSTNCC
jgi:hypothetical protein